MYFFPPQMLTLLMHISLESMVKHTSAWALITMCLQGYFFYFFEASLHAALSMRVPNKGTEGFKGHIRVIYPTRTATFRSTLSLFPPQVAFPMCTIENVPRMPVPVSFCMGISLPSDC